MSFSLANSALLPLLALISVPVLLHFFARSRPRTYLFSSVEFLRQVVVRTSRIKRPQSWLLLALRTLLVAALILMFLQPVLEHDQPLAGSGERKHVVVLVDASASMAAMEGARTRFATACARASEVLSSLSSGDSANVVWIRSPSRPEYPSMGTNVAGLQETLRAARVTHEAGDARGAFTLALGLLRDLEGHREIHLVSDFQKTNWENFTVPPLEGARLVTIQTGSGLVRNQAVTRIHMENPRPLAGETVEVMVEVQNFSDEGALRRVFLRSGAQVESREVRLLPWSSAAVAFLSTFHQPGEQVMHVSIDEDDFPADNERRLVVEVREFLRAGVIGEPRPTANWWRRALGAISWVQAERLTLDDKSGGNFADYDFILWDGWDGSHLQELRQYVAGGGTLICFPAPETSIGAFAQLIAPGEAADSAAGAGGVDTAGSASVFRSHRLDPPRRLQIAGMKSGLFDVFSEGRHGDPAAGVFFSRLHLSAGGDEGYGNGSGPGETILAYDDGVPALVQHRHGPGAVWLWNLPLDPADSNWAARMEFVPFMGELLLAHRQGVSRLMEFVAGQAPVRSFEVDVLNDEVRLTSAAGDFPVRRAGEADAVEAGNTFVAVEVPPIGAYEWQLQSAPAGYSVVNFPTAESDLRLMEEGTLAGGEAVLALSGDRSVSALREGTPLWPWLLAVTILCAVVETAVVLRLRPSAVAAA